MPIKSILIIIAILGGVITTSHAGETYSKDITVYKNPECRCCKRWISYLKKNDYNVTEISTRDIYAEKIRLGVPEKLAACHTAVIDGYVVEGHVTTKDIKRLLLLRPDVKGIAVPGMPVGTPGMEKGSSKEPYNVMTFDENGNSKVFVKHE